MILGWVAFFVGLALQAGNGKIDGSILIPLPIIYAAMLLRNSKEEGHANA